MGHRRCVQVLITAAVVGLVVSGCGQNELGRYTGYQPNMWVVKDPKRIRNQIVKSENYWIQKEVEPEEQFPGPTPDDLEAPEEDYILGSGDLIDITVFELMQPGQPYVTRQRVSQSGRVTFPYLGTIKCAGLTTHGLEEKLGDLLEPDYLVDPQVTVFVTEYRNLSVSVLNGVARPGIYPMSKQDMTLLELVAMSGGVLQLTEDYGYVIREYSPDEADLLMLEGGTPPPEGVEVEAGEGEAPEKPGEAPE
ncbi:MAG: polysaccharide biosynthesis/export family protein, partial [Planctomycetota bacterium]|nr:polysaccharide biosynthesis/export family protein [Planctomycetota bacterium]